jgi:thiol:disulfide interchange protein DsbD
VDEKITLPEGEQEAVSVPTSDGNSRQKAIKTVGDRWSTLETLTFGSNTQPYYVLLDTDETLLANPVGYSYSSDITRYREYLKCGLDAYEEQHAVPSLFN